MIFRAFKEFYEKEGERAFERLSPFFEEIKEQFYSQKTETYLQEGNTFEEAYIKTRQSWVTTVGKSLEKIIEFMLEEFCKNHNLKLVKDTTLKSKKLDNELNLVKRSLLIDFGEYALLPDADIVLYKPQKDFPKILAVLSIKNSFRERFTETPYWKLKLKENALTKNVKVFMITPDKDNEISFDNDFQKARKARIVMEYELDGIYLAKEEFDSSTKIKSISELIRDLKALL